MYDEETLELLKRSREHERTAKRYWVGPEANKIVTTAEMLAIEAPHLTRTQRQVLSETLEKAVPSVNLRTQGWLRNRYDKIITENPALIAKVPTVEELLEALGGSQMLPAERIEKFRALSRLSEQERLDMLPPEAKAKSGTETKDEEPTKAAPPAAKTFREMDGVELDAIMARRHGMTLEQYRHNTLASEVMRWRHALKTSVPARNNAPAVDPNDPEFARLSPQERIRRYRAGSK